ncbi:low density lipoprotein receptor adapter protein 1-B-like isoform X2 [Halichondria panicea]|uniref:low density lipoprotein receptor adapter protein 1-B-like isoform X2 n=1 Tax=Halichondria panicea TaxID=6063 RepID=UPI00312B6E90
MDSLRAAGKAIRNSPKAIRKRFGHDSPPKHDKLDEDWYHSDDPINAGVTFFVKYLGSTSVTKTHGPGSTDDAVQSIVHHAKSRGGKLQKVQMIVSSKIIKLEDVQKQIKLEEIPLYRVSYCTVDPYFDKVFCYICRNHENKELECHAFLCSKKSKAEAITLTVAQAFNIAFERWQAHKKRKESQKKARENVKTAAAALASVSTSNGAPPQQTKPDLGEELKTPSPLPVPIIAPPTVIEPSPMDNVVEGMAATKIEISPPLAQPKKTNPFASADDSQIGLLDVKSTMSKAISLDYLRMEDDLDSEFTLLAEARSNPHLLDIGSHLDRSGHNLEVTHHMSGDKTADELSMTKSIDDLLMY